jgi:hypothetical protein
VIKEVMTDAEVLATLPVVQQLRLHPKEEEYLEVVRRLERLVYRLSFTAEDRGVQCLAGFRVVEFFGPRKVPLRKRPRGHRGRRLGGPRHVDARLARWGGAGRGLWDPPARLWRNGTRGAQVLHERKGEHLLLPFLEGGLRRSTRTIP